jgi:hypothetical protein
MRGKVRKAEARARAFRMLRDIFVQSTADLLYTPLTLTRWLDQRWLER